jgi:hypothetical protein
MNDLIILFVAEMFVIAAMWHGKSRPSEKKKAVVPVRR